MVDSAKLQGVRISLVICASNYYNCRTVLNKRFKNLGSDSALTNRNWFYASITALRLLLLFTGVK